MNKKLVWRHEKFEKVDEEEFLFMCAPNIPERGVSSFRTHQQGIGEGYLYKEKDSKESPIGQYEGMLEGHNILYLEKFIL